MKNLSKATFLAAALMLAASSIASAQVFETNRDENGNIVRGAYLTNKWNDNWFIGIAGGVQSLYSKDNKMMITPEVDLTVTKWFTPVIGARLGYQGFYGREGYQSGSTYFPDGPGNHSYFQSFDPQKNILDYGMFYIHGDVIWNAINTFWGYKQDRFWNIGLYAHAGYLKLYDNKEGNFKGLNCPRHDREAGVGLGILNNFRLGERLVLTVDLRDINFSGRFHTQDGRNRVNNLSASAGLAYNFNSTYWKRSRGIEKNLDNALMSEREARAALDAAQKAADALRGENAQLAGKVGALEEEIKKLQDAAVDEIIVVPTSELQRRINSADLVLYYELGVSKLNFSERHHLSDFVKASLEADPKHVFFLTGSADKGTGTEEINIRLSHERAELVKQMMIEKLGVPANQVVIKATLVSDAHAANDPEADRCVLIENK